MNKPDKDILDNIKKRSPNVYRILKEQQSQKWEITSGRKFSTETNTSSNKYKRSTEEILYSYNQ